jgi:hypothetical protein
MGMLATSISREEEGRNWVPKALGLSGLKVMICAAAFLFVSRAAEETSANSRLAAVAKAEYEAARARFQANPHDPEAAWQAGRASFDWAEFSRDDDERERIAKIGIMASRHAVELDPKSAPARYYLGLNLGQLAQTKSVGALKIVNEMEEEWKRAAELDPTFDHGGSHRVLGALYLEAPGWPLSVGSRKKARAQIEMAVALAPEYPENRLYLLEARIKWDDKKGAAEAMKRCAELLPKARESLKGERWEGHWIDWDRRWAAALQKLRQKWPDIE